MTEYFQDEIGARSFTELSDSPSSYTGQGGKAVFVKGTEDGLELSDVPSPAVTINELTDVDTTGKSAGRILEFDASGNMVVGDKSATASTSFTSLTDTPSSYVGQAGNVATVNPTEDGIIFSSVEGGGLVDSVFGRIGAVTAQAGDYNSNLVNNSSTVAGSSVTAALNTVNTALTNIDNALDDKMDKLGAGTSGNLLIRDTLGNAADSGVAFTNLATAAQGALADSAVQPADLATVATTGNYADLVNTPYDLYGSTQDLIAYNGVTSAGDLWVANKGYSGDGRGVCTWVATSTTGQTPSQTPLLRDALEVTDATGRVWELSGSKVSPRMLGAGTTSDDTLYVNLAVRGIAATTVTPPTIDYVEKYLDFEGGVYNVSTLDFTGLLGGRNYIVEGNGAVLVANTPGKKVIDCTGSRWLWFKNLIVHSENVESEAAWQWGPKGTETCGNNKMFFCQALGNFSRAPVTNYGSETTQYYSCRFSNNSSNASSFAYIGDGAGVYTYTSDYVTVTRGALQAVSFTNNKFYGCQFRSLNAGQPLFLSGVRDWEVDSACYLLGFNGAAVTLWQSTAIRNVGVNIYGLFETAGLAHMVELVGSEPSAVEGLKIDTPQPHASTSYIKNSTGTTITVRHSKIRIRYPFASYTPDFFEGSGITYYGSIETRYGAGLNLGTLAAFSGEIFCDDIDNIQTLPLAGGYSIRDEVGESISIGHRYLGMTSWTTVPVTLGSVTPVASFNNLTPSSPINITDISATGLQGFNRVTFRNAGSANAVFVYNVSKIRNNSGGNLTLAPNQSVTYVKITDTLWQEV